MCLFQMIFISNMMNPDLNPIIRGELNQPGLLQSATQQPIHILPSNFATNQVIQIQPRFDNSGLVSNLGMANPIVINPVSNRIDSISKCVDAKNAPVSTGKLPISKATYAKKRHKHSQLPLEPDVINTEIGVIVKTHKHEDGSDKEMFSCSECEHEFTRRSTAQAHIKAVHLGLTHKCHLCGKAFQTKSGLKNHTLIHLGIFKYTCGICQKGFVYKGEYENHLARHQKDG